MLIKAIESMGLFSGISDQLRLSSGLFSNGRKYWLNCPKLTSQRNIISKQ